MRCVQGSLMEMTVEERAILAMPVQKTMRSLLNYPSFRFVQFFSARQGINRVLDPIHSTHLGSQVAASSRLPSCKKSSRCCRSNLPASCFLRAWHMPCRIPYLVPRSFLRPSPHPKPPACFVVGKVHYHYAQPKHARGGYASVLGMWSQPCSPGFDLLLAQTFLPIGCIIFQLMNHVQLTCLIS
jgi:hypothetical protein